MAFKPYQSKKMQPNSNLLKEYKTTLKPFTQEQRDIIIGTLLGDSTIQRSRVRIKWEQTSSVSEYVCSVYDLFHPYVGTPPKLASQFDKRTSQIYYTMRFQTYSHENIQFYKDLFYQGDSKDTYTKIVPLDIEQYLTPRALAHWFMGDGSKHKNSGYKFATDSFTFTEHELLQTALKNKFNLVVTIQKHGESNILYLKGCSRGEFNALIKPHLHPDFYYRYLDRD